MIFWIAIALLALVVIAGLAFAVRRAGGRNTIAIVVALAVPGIALGIYSTTGAPDLPDQPYAAREDVAQHNEVAGLLNELAAKLEADPTRLDGWLLLGRSRLKIGDPAGAAEAFDRARKLAPDDGSIASEFAEASIHAADGIVSDEARAALALAHEKNARDTKALFYLGHDAVAQGKYAEGIQHWVNLIALSPRDAAWIPDLAARVTAAAQEGKVDLATVRPTLAPDEQFSGPSQEQIRAMVDGLAARLQDNPDDLAGWRMLAKSWRVLGEAQKADEADTRVKALEAKQ